jgi:hypothetical protein
LWVPSCKKITIDELAPTGFSAPSFNPFFIRALAENLPGRSAAVLGSGRPGGGASCRAGRSCKHIRSAGRSSDALAFTRRIGAGSNGASPSE